MGFCISSVEILGSTTSAFMFMNALLHPHILLHRWESNCKLNRKLEGSIYGRTGMSGRGLNIPKYPIPVDTSI
jgi:hypothetical protein